MPAGPSQPLALCCSACGKIYCKVMSVSCLGAALPNVTTSIPIKREEHEAGGGGLCFQAFAI